MHDCNGEPREKKMSILDFYSKFRSKAEVSSANKLVAEASAQEGWASSFDDDQLKNEFHKLKLLAPDDRIVKGLALTREAARRTLGLRQHDVQLIGGVVLLQGKLAEMRTGEGKTLTIVAPAALHALEGKGVHVVTSNAYLAKRDANLMRPVYAALGLTVAAIHAEQSPAEKKEAYAADITYGIGSEFGFDYLKDHMASSPEGQVQTRGLYAAIVDEVDSILIDEARVPLIISDKAEGVADAVMLLDACLKQLKAGVHYVVDLKERTANLTEEGYTAVEQALVHAGVIASEADLYDANHLMLARRLHSAVKAYGLFKRDQDYVVEGDEIVLVDAGTGRKMKGRRLDDGIHEALEARESLPIQEGTVTKATITYQNFFALYAKLSGLTGTAITEAEEFSDIYNLETVQVPTNKPIIRTQKEDLVFLNKKDKFQAAAQEVRERNEKGQPCLVGCGSITDALAMSHQLSKIGLRHETLTARHVEKEASIIAGAGRLGAITVATNVAGRGTDIVLGGEKPHRQENQTDAEFNASLEKWSQERETVLSAGGLFVLGTERNGIRRVDNQFAGRSGRQGDPGEVQFLLSLEDDLLQIFGLNKHLNMVKSLIENAGQALGGKTVSKLIVSSQQRVEGQGYSARKSLMQYDKVLSDQRRAVYQVRDDLMYDGARGFVLENVATAVNDWIALHFEEDSNPSDWPLAELKNKLQSEFGVEVPLLKWVAVENLKASEILVRLQKAATATIEATLPSDKECRELALEVLAELWTEHLSALEELKNNVSLKPQNGLNPLFQFGQDAFKMFEAFQAHIGVTLAEYLLKEQKRAERLNVKEEKTKKATGNQKVAIELEKRWVTRNEKCPCGSGLRFKECHGIL